MTPNPEHVQLLILDHERAREHLREQLRTQTPLMIAELITHGWTAQRIGRKCGRSREHIQSIHRRERRAGAGVAFAIAGALIEARKTAGKQTDTAAADAKTEEEAAAAEAAAAEAAAVIKHKAWVKAAVAVSIANSESKAAEAKAKAAAEAAAAMLTEAREGTGCT